MYYQWIKCDKEKSETITNLTTKIPKGQQLFSLAKYDAFLALTDYTEPSYKLTHNYTSVYNLNNHTFYG